MTFRRQKHPETKAFTLIELLITVGIIGVLATILVVAIRPALKNARGISELNNLKQVTQATLAYTAENDGKLPSPQYPGGHAGQERLIPEQWDFMGTGSGLWLDGVVFYAVFGKEGGLTSDTGNGQHLRGTPFASQQSFIKTGNGNPDSTNWYEHSYAMNKDIQYDFLYEGAANAELTNKTLANIPGASTCLLFIENSSSNIIGASDRDDIIQTGKDRWGEKADRVHAAFLDGSVQKMKADEIPDGSGSDLESSRFWHGVDP